MTFRFVSLPALVVAATLAGACDVHVGENGVSLDVATGRAQDQWSRTYKLPAGGTIEVVNVNGTITIEGQPIAISSGLQAVTVTAERKVRAGSDEEAKQALDKLQIAEDVKPDHVKIQSPGGTEIGAFRRTNLTIDYHLRVPAGLKVAVKTQNGGVNLRDVNGTLTASTTNGGIRGSGLSGTVSAHTVNGGIVIDLARVSGPINIDVVNGGVRLDLPADLKADIEARAVNGGVTTEAGLAVTVTDRQRSSLTGTLNGGGVKISASTVNGGVRIGARSGAGPQATADDDDRQDADIVVERKSKGR